MKIINGYSEEESMIFQGEVDLKKNILSYIDKDILVNIILGDTIIMKRKHPDYELELVFEKEQKRSSKYEIFNPKMSLEVETETIELVNDNNKIHIKYGLRLNNEDMGIFSVDFEMEE